MVTAETAVALPSLVLVLGIALAVVEAASTRLACVDAARAGARALARGESDDAVRAVVTEVAPNQAETELSQDSRFARVAVSAPVEVGAGIAIPINVGGTAATPKEPGA